MCFSILITIVLLYKRRSAACAVKRLSRHILSRELLPVFHDPLDSLAPWCVMASPGSEKQLQATASETVTPFYTRERYSCLTWSVSASCSAGAYAAGDPHQKAVGSCPVRNFPEGAGTESRGRAAGGDFFLCCACGGKKYNRLPLDAVTRYTLGRSPETTPCFGACPPARDYRGPGDVFPGGCRAEPLPGRRPQTAGVEPLTTGA